jgi:hypothetical protein
VRLQLGGSFGCLRGNPHARACGSKEPPPQLTRSTDFGTSPRYEADLGDRKQWGSKRLSIGRESTGGFIFESDKSAAWWK